MRRVRFISTVGFMVGIGCGPRADSPPVAPRPPVSPPRIPDALVASERPEHDQPLAKVQLEGFEGEVERVLSAKWVGTTEVHQGALDYHRAARLVPGGTAYGDDQAPALPHRHRVWILEAGDEPRLVVRQGGVRLLVYAREDDLQTFVAAHEILRDQPGAPVPTPPTQARVELGPGAPVKVLEHTDGWSRVVHEDDERFEGWLETASLSTSYRDETFPSLPETYAQALTTRNTPLLERPGGERWDELPADAFVFVVRPSKRRHLLVTYRGPCDQSVRLTGYVRRAHLNILDESLGRGGLVGCGRGGGDYPMTLGDKAGLPRTTLSAGRLLLAVDSNRVVGCVVEATEAAQGEHDIVYLQTVWGPMPVRAAPAGVEETCFARD